MDKTIDKHFALKKWGSTEDDDTEFSFRAYIRHTVKTLGGQTIVFVTLFPPAQYKSVENKNAFNLALNEYLADLDWIGVEVTQGGKAAFSFNRNP